MYFRYDKSRKILLTAAASTFIILQARSFFLFNLLFAAYRCSLFKSFAYFLGMINESLKFLSEEVNKFLSFKLGVNTDPRFVLGNIAKAGDNDKLLNKGIISLINIEEDRIAKQQENFVRTENSLEYKKPPLYLNLYVLFAVNHETTYSESLIWISYVIQMFQNQNVFTPLSHPNIDSRIQKLLVDLFTLNFEQTNHLWSTLGGKYLPSVLFKIRQITINEDAAYAGGALITEIDINGVSKQMQL